MWTFRILGGADDGDDFTRGDVTRLRSRNTVRGPPLVGKVRPSAMRCDPPVRMDSQRVPTWPPNQQQ